VIPRKKYYCIINLKIEVAQNFLPVEKSKKVNYFLGAYTCRDLKINCIEEGVSAFDCFVEKLGGII
jgi:hypothetical protein